MSNKSQEVEKQAERQLSHLNSQVGQLHANIADFHELLTTTASQYEMIEKLGKMQAHFLLAANSYFEEENSRDDVDADAETGGNTPYV
ncbi:uncharacterized protein SPAPADRAFT_60583 [Spathaspora passalidarum NRRL Y-27907]|uniref:Uncharacterized protein n=1 Tax=Spathaspora passalidarum (strain NRRL Y-27907 / 11-Y1) TaxID=619300 RepID=G3ALJ8_SPAPN|nr:uncharacterized protein SPAPADRAFT_60583 [Spathaspora passalidarum NRRL Y-27907]EGW33241.1 hypothetical protein SPAPADRAFT_60583 [Spathaspora passalidarum NRRL Y-27907]